MTKVNKSQKAPQNEPEVEYVYRTVAVENPLYPGVGGVQKAINKGYTDDCTPEEYEKYFDKQLRRSLTPFRLMRKKVVK